MENKKNIQDFYFDELRDAFLRLNVEINQFNAWLQKKQELLDEPVFSVNSQHIKTVEDILMEKEEKFKLIFPTYYKQKKKETEIKEEVVITKQTEENENVRKYGNVQPGDIHKYPLHKITAVEEYEEELEKRRKASELEIQLEKKGQKPVAKKKEFEKKEEKKIIEDKPIPIFPFNPDYTPKVSKKKVWVTERLHPLYETEKFRYLKYSIKKGVVTAEQGKKLPVTALEDFPSLKDVYNSLPEYLKTKKDRQKSKVLKQFEKSFQQSYYKLQKEYFDEYDKYQTSIKNKDYLNKVKHFTRKKTNEIKNNKKFSIDPSENEKRLKYLYPKKKKTKSPILCYKQQKKWYHLGIPQQINSKNIVSSTIKFFEFPKAEADLFRLKHKINNNLQNNPLQKGSAISTPIGNFNHRLSIIKQISTNIFNLIPLTNKKNLILQEGLIQNPAINQLYGDVIMERHSQYRNKVCSTQNNALNCNIGPTRKPSLKIKDIILETSWSLFDHYFNYYLENLQYYLHYQLKLTIIKSWYFLTGKPYNTDSYFHKIVECLFNNLFVIREIIVNPYECSLQLIQVLNPVFLVNRFFRDDIEQKELTCFKDKSENEKLYEVDDWFFKDDFFNFVLQEIRQAKKEKNKSKKKLMDWVTFWYVNGVSSQYLRHCVDVFDYHQQRVAETQQKQK